MVVIYNDSFLEKLRRLDGLVTITSYAFLEGKISKTLTPEEILNLESSDSYDNNANPMAVGLYKYLEGENDLRAIWEKDTKKLKVCVNVPETIIEDYENSGAFDSKDFLICTQAIRFRYLNDLGKEELAFVLVNPKSEVDNRIELGLIDLSLDRNLITIQLPEYTVASIRAINSNADDTFLSSYAADLGKNLFTVSDSGEVHITKDSFYKYFGIKIHKLDEEAVPFIVNDTPILDEFGNKIEQIYTCREYTDVNIFCSGVDNSCWIPTKFDLYRNYIDGEIRIYGTAKYREYKVIGSSREFIGTGEETISTLTGLYFEEVDNRGLVYEINHDHQTLSYELPETEDFNPNASVTLRAVVTKPNGEQLRSNPIRFMLGGREDEWRVQNKTTEYIEPLNGEEVPVFLFPYDVTVQSKYKHQLVIRTSLEVEKKEDLELTLSDKLSDYFNVDIKLKKEYEMDNFKHTIITLTLKPKQVNKETVKWYPLNDKEESELMLATISYSKYETPFYMVQSPKVQGLRLYEFNSLGACFSAISKIEFDATEKSRIYWMLAEEKTEPKIRPWWTSYTSIKNRHRGIQVIGTEYNQKDSYIKYEKYKSGKDAKHTVVTEKSVEGDLVTYYLNTKNEQGEVIKTETLFVERLNPGRGLFTVLPSRALRPDIEVTGSTSSGFYLKSDVEMLPNLKYLTVFDSFSIDSNGYITLNSSKIVGNNGLVQADTSVGKNTIVGGVSTTETDLVSPITRTLSTYINNKNLGIEVSAINYKSATVNNSSTLIEDKDGNIVKRDGNSTFDSKDSKSADQNKLQTLVSTDGKLVNDTTKQSSSYYFTKADVVGDYLSDRDSATSTGLTTAVNRSVTDTELITSSDRLMENTSDSVIAFVREDGTIGYTSKSDGIAVKMVTDFEGRLVMDPRKIWNNVKLRPVIIKIPEMPKDVRDIEDTDNPFDPITFYRVNDELEAKSFEDTGGKFPKDTWRNMVRRAQITYAVNKKGQEPFIQIIGDGMGLGKDIKYKTYKGGRLVTRVLPAVSTDIPISYIKRNSFLVRSNCPFKLSISYNTGFEGTLEFDKQTREMKKYIISNDAQSLYCPIPKFDSTLGSGVFINIMEADWTGTVGKITASYGDLVRSVDVIANEFSGKTEITEVDSKGRVKKGADKNLIVMGSRESRNLYFSARRTLKAQFTSYRDTIGEDKEPVKVTTPDYCRVPIRYSSSSTPGFRVSKISPRFDEEGYVNHGTTLDLEVINTPKYPLDPVGKLSISPYKVGFNKGASYYIYNRGQNPYVKIDDSNYIGVLGGEHVDDPSQIDPATRKMLNREITNITANNVVYNLSKWEDMEQVTGRRITSKRINGSNEDVPVQEITVSDNNAAKPAKMLPSATRVTKSVNRVYEGISFGTPGYNYPIYVGYINDAIGKSSSYPGSYIQVNKETWSSSTGDTESGIVLRIGNQKIKSKLSLNSSSSGSNTNVFGYDDSNSTIGIYLVDVDGFIFLRPNSRKSTLYKYWYIQNSSDDEAIRLINTRRVDYTANISATIKPLHKTPDQYIDRITTPNTINDAAILLHHCTKNVAGLSIADNVKPWHLYSPPKSVEIIKTTAGNSVKGTIDRYYSSIDQYRQVWETVPINKEVVIDNTATKISIGNIQSTSSSEPYRTAYNTVIGHAPIRINIDPAEPSYVFSFSPVDGDSTEILQAGHIGNLNTSSWTEFTITDGKWCPGESISSYLGDGNLTCIGIYLDSQSDYTLRVRRKLIGQEIATSTIEAQDRLIYTNTQLSPSVIGGAVYQYKNKKWSPYYDIESSGTTVVLDNVKWPTENQISIKKHKKDVNNKIYWEDINLKNNTSIYGFYDTTGNVTDDPAQTGEETLRFVQSTSSHEDNSIKRWFVTDVQKKEDGGADYLFTKIKGTNTLYKFNKYEGDNNKVSVWGKYEPAEKEVMPVNIGDKEYTYYERSGGNSWNLITDNRVVLFSNDIDKRHFYYNLSPSGLKPTMSKVIISITTDGLIKFVPIRWRNVATGSTVYTVPGAKIGTELLDSDVKSVEDIIYTANNTKGLDDGLYITIEDPILWSAINTEEVTALKNDREITYFVSNSETPLVDNTTLFTQDDRELTGKTAKIVDLKKKMTFNTIAKYKDTVGEVKVDYDILDTDGAPIKAVYEYNLPYVNLSSNRRIVKSYETFIMLRGSTIPVQVIECDDKKKYIRRTNRLASYCPRVYTEKIGSKITKMRYKPEKGDSILNETTFTILSRYRLQYPKIEEIGDKFEITSTPTKLFYQYDSDDDTKQKKIFDGVNIESKSLKEIASITDPETRGQEYSKALDVDINVFPRYEGEIPLFRISNISESYDTTSGLYSYNITVIPKTDYEGEGRQYCGSIKITSRVREVFRDNDNVPVDILNYYPKVLPLYNEGGKVIPSTGKTRPLSGLVFAGTQKREDGRDVLDFAYESTILSDNQSNLSGVIPEDTLTIDVYQQKNNLLQMSGDRSSEIVGDTNRIYSAIYQPGSIYPEDIKLEPQSLKMYGEFLGWNRTSDTTDVVAKFKTIYDLVDHWPAQIGDVVSVYRADGTFEHNYYLNKRLVWEISPSSITSLFSVYIHDDWKTTMSSLLKSPTTGTIVSVEPQGTIGPLVYYVYSPGKPKNVNIVSNNYDPIVGTTASSSGFSYPYVNVYFNSILNSYLPETPKFYVGGLKSAYKDSDYPTKSILYRIEVGNWIPGSGSEAIDTGERFRPNIKDDGLPEERTEDGIVYIEWIREELSGKDGFKVYPGFKLLIPKEIDGQSFYSIDEEGVAIPNPEYLKTISINNPLDGSLILYETIDDDIDDNYLQNTKHKYIVKYELGNDSSAEKKDAIAWCKLWNTKSTDSSMSWSWNPYNKRAYSEIVTYDLPGFNKGIVCATTKNTPKVYIGDNVRKNTVKEFATGKETTIDFFAGLFDLTSHDSVLRNLDKTTYYIPDLDDEGNTKIMEVGGVTYFVYARYSGTTKSNKFALLLPQQLPGEITPDNPLIPNYVLWPDKTYTEGFTIDGKNWAIVSRDGDKLYEYSNDGNIGTMEISVTKNDSITKDWSYEILSDAAVFDKETGEYANNIRLTFPPNENDDTITRSFKIRATNPDNGVYHEVILNIDQGSYLGTIICEDRARFTSDGEYYSGVEDDPFFYFDTDIPSSELEFTVRGDDNAFPYLGVGDNTISAYGADFKKYRLSIKLSKNFGKTKLTKTLVITRTYNLYDPTTGKLTPKKKVIKTVSLVQGYETIYLGNPSRLQDNLLGKLDSDNPTPEFLTPGMIAGSFYNPLLVPKDHSVRVSDSEGGTRKVMNYTFQLYYETCNPNEEGDFTTIKRTGDDLRDYISDFNVKGEWKIYDDSGSEESGWTIDNIFEEGYETKLVSDSSQEYKSPCIENFYVTKEEFVDVSVRVYVTITVGFQGKTYRYYAYMKKVDYDLKYPKVELNS